jgi:hypothetical protein
MLSHKVVWSVLGVVHTEWHHEVLRPFRRDANVDHVCTSPSHCTMSLATGIEQ